MKVLHIASNTNGYEEVELVANRINRKNHLSLIEKDGIEYMTGGFLFGDNPIIRAIFDSIPAENQYEMAKMIRQEPFVKCYAEE